MHRLLLNLERRVNGDAPLYTLESSGQLHFAVFISILQFYRGYRVMERSLMVLYPSTGTGSPLPRSGQEVDLRML